MSWLFVLPRGTAGAELGCVGANLDSENDAEDCCRGMGVSCVSCTVSIGCNGGARSKSIIVPRAATFVVEAIGSAASAGRTALPGLVSACVCDLVTEGQALELGLGGS